MLSAVLVAWVTASAQAAELGPIRLNSGIGQPLSAEIPVANLQPNEFELLAVRLAAPEFFQQAGLKHLTALNRLNLRITRKPDGNAAIALTTREPVSEPVLAFLLEFYSAHGRTLREYTVLLDAEPMLAAEKAALAKVAREEVAREGMAQQAASTAAPAPKPAPRPVKPASRPKPVPAVTPPPQQDKLLVGAADAGRIQQLEAEISAQRHSLQEVEARISGLEKLIADLNRLLQEQHPAAEVQPPVNLKPWLIWGGAALGLLLLAGGGLWFWRRRKAKAAASPKAETKAEATAAAAVPAPPAAPPVAAAPAAATAEEEAVEAAAATPATGDGPLDLSGIDLDLNTPAAPPAATEPAPSAADLAALAEWEAMAAAEAAAEAPPPAAASEPEPTDADKAALAEWEAMLAQEGGAAEAAAPSPAEAPAEAPAAVVAAEAAPETAEGGGDYTMQASFELARAYIEVGDVEGAREVLTEVVQRGNEAEQQEAQRMLGELG